LLFSSVATTGLIFFSCNAAMGVEVGHGLGCESAPGRLEVSNKNGINLLDISNVNKLF